ncbi:DNA gyrase subunit A, partial [Patescibacteria group bacterium]|nr:DNA gyrase subunit A [Patescibacteria group bacterium]
LILTLNKILTEYIRHRQKVITRRTQFDLEAAKNRAHILEGLKIALDNLDAVIETIKKSKDVDTARSNLMIRFKLTEIQANAILDMQLRRLAALERKKIEDEYKEVLKTISLLEDLLDSPKKILKEIERELTALKDKYGDSRRTRVYPNPIGEFAEEDLIPSEEVIVTVTESGYIKRSPISTFRSQGRGGKGVSGVKMKEEDTVSDIFSANTHDSLMFFTNTGRVFQIKVYELPEGSRYAKGAAVINLINLESGESITSILAVPKKDTTGSGFLFMATKGGMVKKTSIKEFEHIRKNGMIAIRLSKGDELTWVKLTSGKDNIILVTKNAMSIKFSEKDVRPMGRPTSGVIGIRLKSGDILITMDKAIENNQLVVVTQKGLGKRSKIADWPLQGRSGLGVRAAELTSRSGKLVAAQVIGKEDRHLIITSKMGQVIKLPMKDVSILTRQTQGVILIRLSDKKDVVAAASSLKPERESGKK